MKQTFLLMWLWLSVSSSGYCQHQAYAKLYLGDSPADLRLTLAPSTPLDVGAKGRAGYAFLETDLSLALTTAISSLVPLLQ